MEQDDDVVLLNTMNNKLRSLKTEYVDKCHVTEDGTPRRISELTTGGKHFFVTYCAGKKKIKSTRLVIMDVEWYELNVLKWMEKSLKEFHDINIIMEIVEVVIILIIIIHLHQADLKLFQGEDMQLEEVKKINSFT